MEISLGNPRDAVRGEDEDGNGGEVTSRVSVLFGDNMERDIEGAEKWKSTNSGLSFSLDLSAEPFLKDVVYEGCQEREGKSSNGGILDAGENVSLSVRGFCNNETMRVHSNVQSSLIATKQVYRLRMRYPQR
ncbi:PREDICTED: uncharacterized protein LOC104606750 [Nelumbo nucifera]|uniref:Uncharacterized protein LOC104606750 n=2 Tax=Nelumbo nucifera TaxID=4432 RepID=A0A1U8AV64_NELNU|nr:PREDICTED: uncharacterized protein LOC104606750 [Nelumbo nucifera]DAD39908.1 TPA_asm: hypothetical protein HUJ06_014231 [Nelumbo nucifera]